MPQRPRILVVDDDVFRDEAVGALRTAGYVVAACGTVPVAERMAVIFRPDLAVLEMVLGGEVVGPDLARRIRADADALLLFVTDTTRDQDLLAAFEAGADEYVRKPIPRDELLARVHASCVAAAA